MQSPIPLRVIKLGGSLLNLVDLRQRFHTWLETQSPGRNLVVVGGGKAVEAIRELDALHHFPSNVTHWSCVDLMSVTAALASKLLGIRELLCTERELNAALSRPKSLPFIACVQPTAYYTRSLAEQKMCNLPESWECTSDSISAWLASSLAAEQLVLLKSAHSESAASPGLSLETIRALADAGAVDPVFPEACHDLPDIRIVNLRSIEIRGAHL